MRDYGMLSHEDLHVAIIVGKRHRRVARTITNHLPMTHFARGRKASLRGGCRTKKTIDIVASAQAGEWFKGYLQRPVVYYEADGAEFGGHDSQIYAYLRYCTHPLWMNHERRQAFSKMYKLSQIRGSQRDCEWHLNVETSHCIDETVLER